MTGAYEERRPCAATTKNGDPCPRYAQEGSEFCRLHGLTPEQRSEMGRRGGLRRAAQRRAEAEPKPRSGISPTVSLEDILRVCADALTATFEHDGSADHSARLAGAAVLLLTFPREYRETPEQARATLEVIIPERALDPISRQQLDAQDAFKALRAEWILRPRWSAVRGLYVAPFPRHFVAPWESYDEVSRNELPADAPPEDADVQILADGWVYHDGVLLHDQD